MKKLTLLLILLIGSLSYGQEPIVIYQKAPDRQKITEFEKRNDSLVISLENSGTNKVYLGDLRTDISGKANINSPTFTGNVIVPTATISDAAVNLGQMMDSLATVGTPLVQELASTKTLTKDDAWIVYRNRSTTSEEFTYTIQNQANGGFTEDIGYTFYTKDNGKIFVKGETGSGVEPVEISGAGQYATIIRVGENSWDWSKGVLPWDPNPNPELYTNSNALGSLNNADSVTGLDPISGTTQSSVANTSPASTSFAWEIVSTSIQENSRGREVLTVDNATGTYEVKFWARQSVGSGSGGARFRMQSTTDDSFTAISDSWTYYEFDITATSINPQIEFFTNRSAAALAVGSVGDAIQVTGFSIKLKP